MHKTYKLFSNVLSKSNQKEIGMAQNEDCIET